MTQKSIVLKAFNTLFLSFLDEVVNLFPENDDLKVAKTSFETIKRLNVTAIIKAWYTYVYIPYEEPIVNGDISFFIDKDYNNDLSQFSNAGDIMAVIDKFRKPIQQMSDENKSHSLHYIQKLSELSKLYN
jgi:hypothetical protein